MRTFNRWAAEDDRWDQDTGAPGISLFGNAVQVWSTMQSEAVSVAAAARAFNVEPSRIIEAVNAHYWMFLSGPEDDYARLMIEDEGE
jgi:hypothetical protein